MSPAITRRSPSMALSVACSHCTSGLSGICAARPGSDSGSARRRATSPRKLTSSGTTGTPASSSDHFTTETYASRRLDASSVPRAGQATRTMRSTLICLSFTSAASRCELLALRRMPLGVERRKRVVRQGRDARQHLGDQPAARVRQQVQASALRRRFGEGDRVGDRAGPQRRVIEPVDALPRRRRTARAPAADVPSTTCRKCRSSPRRSRARAPATPCWSRRW